MYLVYRFLTDESLVCTVCKRNIRPGEAVVAHRHDDFEGHWSRRCQACDDAETEA